jgi:hypothetical protein
MGLYAIWQGIKNFSSVVTFVTAFRQEGIYNTN